ncbi:uncharacterized protein PG998_005965 [Apiospora kogelbergensis]|uniref:Uncharacterized protein n=1 Tax=Apiospora kogelbergensis TaxID=1337665 RepID=A0AAW0R3V7_9PEZI
MPTPSPIARDRELLSLLAEPEEDGKDGAKDETGEEPTACGGLNTAVAIGIEDLLVLLPQHVESPQQYSNVPPCWVPVQNHTNA